MGGGALYQNGIIFLWNNVIVVVVLLLATKSHTNRSHLSNIIPIHINIFKNTKKHLSPARDISFFYKRAP